MAEIIPYDRERALEYAENWAFKRNPRFFDFEKLGGDCTNFVSQILLAGGCTMNCSKINGWYYKNVNDRSPSWTGVNFLYNFLTSNKLLGPFATKVGIEEIEVGDIIQLRIEGEYLYDHSLIISKIDYPISIPNLSVSSHSHNRFDSQLSSIKFNKYRFLHVLGSYK